MQNDKEKIAIRKKMRVILPFSTKKHAIFYDEKLRGLWGEPFGFENFFVKIDEDL
jgi:hypothetical protein